MFYVFGLRICRGKPFLASLIFLGAYLKGEHLKGVPPGLGSKPWATAAPKKYQTRNSFLK